MPKRKIKTKNMLLKLSEEDYKKVVLQAGKYRTLTSIIEDNIRLGYIKWLKSGDSND